MELTQRRVTGRGLKSMLATRQGLTLVAVTSALIAAGILVYAISHYRQGANAGSTQDTVLVASGLIQKGTSGTAIATGNLYRPAQVVSRQVSTGALTDAAALQGKVAVEDILPGQQLTAADFAPGAAGVVGQLAVNQRAIAIPLDAAHGLSGVVQAGDRVDLYTGFNVQGAGPTMRLLIPNVRVLQVPAAGATGNVILAINDNQAAEVAFASGNGTIWLTLRPGNAQNATQTVASLNSILAGSQPIPTGGKP
jgi:Flp pilus assembly protein CpaB